MWVVYIAKCRDGTFYTGITNNLEKRIQNHNAGRGARYTAARRPIKLVYSENTDNRSTASQREYQIKQLSRAAKIALIASQD